MSKKQKKIKLDKLQDVILTEKQQEFYKKIRNNAITFSTGPAGCLTKNEKIRVYVFKSKKNITRNIQKNY